MKRGILLCLLSVLFALPASAGKVTIKETETAIIAEYTGEASDSKPGKPPEEQPANQTQAQSVAPPPAAVDTGSPKQTSDGQSAELSNVKSSDPEQEEARKKKRAEKRAARRGVRQSGAERSEE